MRQPTYVFVGGGSNIQPWTYLPMAVAKMRDYFGALTLSKVYQSDPVGFVGEPFLNIVIGFGTTQAPQKIIDQLHDIESDCGRDRGQEKHARRVDLDLLLYGGLIDKDLRIPRKDITQYAFVLRPLAEMVPTLHHPENGHTYAELWQTLGSALQPLTPVDIHL